MNPSNNDVPNGFHRHIKSNQNTDEILELISEERAPALEKLRILKQRDVSRKDDKEICIRDLEEIRKELQIIDRKHRGDFL